MKESRSTQEAMTPGANAAEAKAPLHRVKEMKSSTEENMILSRGDLRNRKLNCQHSERGATKMSSPKPTNRVIIQVDRNKNQVIFTADGPLPIILIFVGVLVVIGLAFLSKGHLW
jgi:hypothetical protein